LHEPAVPALHRWMRACGLSERAIEEPAQRGSRMARDNPGIAHMLSKRAHVYRVAGQLVNARYQPLPTYIDAHDQPEPRHTCVGEHEPRDGRFGNLCGSPGLHVFHNTHDCYLCEG